MVPVSEADVAIKEDVDASAVEFVVIVELSNMLLSIRSSVRVELMIRSISEAEVLARVDIMFLLKHIDRIVDPCHVLL